MTDLPPESNRLRDDHHPTPFSAAQIREASPAGTSVAFLVEPAGAEPYVDRWEFLESDDRVARRRQWRETVDGGLLEEPIVAEATWVELQGHASYPAASTTVEAGRAAVPAGEYDCWIYTRQEGDSTTRAAFAKDLPGPPVLVEAHRAGEPAFTMSLLEVGSPSA